MKTFCRINSPTHTLPSLTPAIHNFCSSAYWFILLSVPLTARRCRYYEHLLFCAEGTDWCGTHARKNSKNTICNSTKGRTCCVGAKTSSSDCVVKEDGNCFVSKDACVASAGTSNDKYPNRCNAKRATWDTLAFPQPDAKVSTLFCVYCIPGDHFICHANLHYSNDPI